jgi:hypothetical protein
MMTKTAMLPLVTLLSMLLAASVPAQQLYSDSERSVLARVLPNTKLSLPTALKTSERMGTPLSARIEVQDNDLVISVYTAKNDDFSEVVFSARSGSILKVQPVDGLKRAAAKGETASLIGATVPLHEAVHRAERANPGYWAIRVIPGVVENRPVAIVMLTKNNAFRTVAEDLY